MGKGGVIGVVNDTYTGYASGIFNLREQHSAQKNGVWPLGVIQGLRYTYYTQSSSTNPTDEAGLNALFVVGGITSYGSAGIHSSNINWGSAGQSGAGGVTTTKPGYLPAEQFSWMVEGYIYAPETGTYTFGCDGDDAMDVHVNSTRVAYYYGGHGFSGVWSGGSQVAGTIFLVAKNLYTFRARMQEGATADGFQVGWRKPSDGSLALIPAASLLYIP